MSGWRRLVGIGVVFAALFCTAGCDSGESSPPSPLLDAVHLSPTVDQPVAAPSPGVGETPAHGLLKPPQYNESLEQLAGRDIRIHPVIKGVAERGARYYIPCDIGGGRFAVAGLRGVDFFNVDSVPLIPDLQIDTPGEAWSVHRVNETLWVADGYAGVTVLKENGDSKLAEWPEYSLARSFHSMDDGRIVVCRHSAGADIITLSDPATIRETIHIDAGNRVFSATSDRNRLFLGTLHGGYIAMNVTPGKDVATIWTYSDCTRIVWCRYQDGLHFLLDQDLGLQILQDRETDAPVRLAKLELPGHSRYACLPAPNQICIANSAEIYSIDVRDPSNPVITDHEPSCQESWGIAAINGQLVVAEGEFGLRTMRLEKGTFSEIRRYEHNGLVSDVVLLDPEHALIAQTRRGLLPIDVSGQDFKPGTRWMDGWHPVASSVQGSRIAVADYNGVILLQRASGLQLQETGRIRTPGRAVNVHQDGDYLYVADWFEGLQIVDASNPSKPFSVSNVPVKGWVIDAMIRDGYAYLCTVNQGLMTVDVRDPSHPKALNCDQSALAPEAAAYGRGCLYVADFNFGLIVYDLSDPAQPVPVSCYRMPVCKNVAVRDDLLLVSNYIHGLKWFDISEPERPVLAGELDTPGKSYAAVFVPERNEVLVADWHDLLRVTW